MTRIQSALLTLLVLLVYGAVVGYAIAQYLSGQEGTRVGRGQSPRPYTHTRVHHVGRVLARRIPQKPGLSKDKLGPPISQPSWDGRR